METKSILSLKVDLSQYQIVRNLNQGGCGKIYLVEKEGLEYAAKVMIFQNFSKEEKEKMIDREIRILMRVNHPTLIKIYGYSITDFNDEDNPTLILEYYENGSLYELLKNIRGADAPDNYEAENRQIILLGIARGMQYLHEHNIIHRDLSTNNILLDDNYYPVIMDFGLSKIYQANHTNVQSSFGGTLYYMSPEVIQQGQKAGPKSDVYSFGIIMFEVITDSSPYPDHEKGKISDFDLKKKIINDDYRPKFDVDVQESLRELVEQCWSKNPDDRPTFSEIFKKLNPVESGDEYVIEDSNIDEINIYVDVILNDSEFREQVFIDNEELMSENEKLTENHSNLKNMNDKLNKKVRISSTKLKKIESEYDRLCIRDNELNVLRLKHKKLTDDLEESTILFKELLHFNKSNAPSRRYFDNLIIQYEKQKKFNALLQAEFDKVQKELNHMNVIEFRNNGYNLGSSNKKEPQKVPDDPRMKEELEEIEIDLFATFIGDHIYENYSKLIVVEIPSLVKRIGVSSFAFCTSLTRVFLPPSVNKLDKKCFYSCFSLNEIEIPPSVECIGESAFELCTELRIISIESPTIDIKDRAFAGCSSLEVVNLLSSSQINIENSIFDKCTSLQQVIISSSLNCIVASLFLECTLLNEVTIPSTVTEIGNFAFYKCSSLEQITIPSSVEEIGIKCFSDCSSLKQIVIPSSVKNIGLRAFANCSSLEQVSFESPSSLIKIWEFTFVNCNSLRQITIPSSIKAIGPKAFYQCSSLEKVSFDHPYSLERICDQAFGECSSLNEITIPSSTLEIGEKAFSFCSSLSDIIIPYSVNCIGRNAFQGCNSLIQISIPSKIKEIKKIGLSLDVYVNQT